jgi:hypothetical protein
MHGRHIIIFGIISMCPAIALATSNVNISRVYPYPSRANKAEFILISNASYATVIPTKSKKREAYSEAGSSKKSKINGPDYSARRNRLYAHH